MARIVIPFLRDSRRSIDLIRDDGCVKGRVSQAHFSREGKGSARGRARFSRAIFRSIFVDNAKTGRLNDRLGTLSRCGGEHINNAF